MIEKWVHLHPGIAPSDSDHSASLLLILCDNFFFSIWFLYHRSIDPGNRCWQLYLLNGFEKNGRKK